MNLFCVSFGAKYFIVLILQTVQQIRVVNIFIGLPDKRSNCELLAGKVWYIFFIKYFFNRADPDFVSVIYLTVALCPNLFLIFLCQLIESQFDATMIAFVVNAKNCIQCTKPFCSLLRVLVSLYLCFQGIVKLFDNCDFFVMRSVNSRLRKCFYLFVWSSIVFRLFAKF